MADYTRIFDGATKDANEDPYNGSDFDREYDGIATAIVTKANLIADTPTVDALINTGAAGDIGDSAIDETYLLNLTEDAQDVLDAATDDLPTGASAQYNHMGRITTVHREVADSSSYVSLGGREVWETLGPIGSGADTEDVSFDKYAAVSPGVMKLLIQLGGYRASSGNGYVYVWTCDPDGDEPTLLDSDNNIGYWNVHELSADESGVVTMTAWVPVGAGGIIKLQWSQSGMTTSSLSCNVQPQLTFSD